MEPGKTPGSPILYPCFKQLTEWLGASNRSRITSFQANVPHRPPQRPKGTIYSRMSSRMSSRFQATCWKQSLFVCLPAPSFKPLTPAHIHTPFRCQQCRTRSEVSNHWPHLDRCTHEHRNVYRSSQLFQAARPAQTNETALSKRCWIASTSFKSAAPSQIHATIASHNRLTNILFQASSLFQAAATFAVPLFCWTHSVSSQ